MAATSLDFVHQFVPAAGVAGAPAAGGTTLLLLHGTGGDENDLVPLGRAVAPGAALLSPRGKVLEGTAPRFFRRLAEGVFDLPDLVARTHELADFVRAAAERYGLDARRIVALGFSNGANIAASALLLHPDLLAGAVLLRAMVPFEPSAPVTLPGTPVYLGAGRFDPIIPPESSARLAALLEQAGARTTLVWQPTGHQLVQAELGQVRDWLAANTPQP
jgi:predicted esterase